MSANRLAHVQAEILDGLGFNNRQIAYFERVKQLSRIKGLSVLLGKYHVNIPETSFPGMEDQPGNRVSRLTVQGLVPDSLYTQDALEDYLHRAGLDHNGLAIITTSQHPKKRICLVAQFYCDPVEGPKPQEIRGKSEYIPHYFDLVVRCNKEGPL